jgi:cell division protein FtsB
VPAIVLSVVVLAIADGDSGVSTWMKLRHELAVSAGRLEALERETDGLRSQIEALERDPFALEQAIREELELAQPGEIVVRFERRTGAPGPWMD